MAKSYLKPLLVAVALSILPMTADAFTVHDPTNAVTLKEQIEKATEQIKKLQEMKQNLEDQISAIGKYGQITLPNINIDSLTRSFNQTLQCTLLNEEYFRSLIPGLKLEDIDVSSVCEGRKLYDDVLFSDILAKNKTKLTHQEISKMNNNVRKYRTNFQKDAAVKGMALSDKAITDSEQSTQAITNLEVSASQAADQNGRLAVLIQGLVIQTRLQAQTNQLLAMMLRNQSMEMVQLYLPPNISTNVTQVEGK